MGSPIRAVLLLAGSLGIAVMSATPADAQATRRDFRVVYAQARQLERELNDTAGRDGYACAAVARVEPGAGAPGVAVVLGRVVGAPAAPVQHLVFAGGESDLQASLARAGADGFRLCGLTLDEGSPRPTVIAVMSRGAGTPAPWQYGIEVLRNYKESLARLAEAARAGALPVAAAPIADNRLPELRTWMVATERPAAGRAAGEIAVRSGVGPDGLTKALNEQGKQGFQVLLIWKEGNDVVAMMARSPGGPATYTYLAEQRSPSDMHFVSGLYLADYAYLSGGDRLVVSDRSVSSSTDVVVDLLPPLGPAGTPPIGATAVLADHLSRNRGFEPASVIIRRGDRGAFVLTTVIVKRSQ